MIFEQKKTQKDGKPVPMQNIQPTEPLPSGSAQWNVSQPQAQGNFQMDDIGPTEPLYASGNPFQPVAQPVPGNFQMDDIGPTEPISSYRSYGYSPVTTPQSSPVTVGPTESGIGYNFESVPSDEILADDSSFLTQVITPNNIPDFMPVVGWLVCIEGQERGKDYRICSGYNNIGRDPSMEICIPSDIKISKDRHAMVAFDPDENQYFFGPVSGRNLVKLNGKVVMAPTELHERDVLTVGTTKLLFVPLCNAEFSWRDE